MVRRALGSFSHSCIKKYKQPLSNLGNGLVLNEFLQTGQSNLCDGRVLGLTGKQERVDHIICPCQYWEGRGEGVSHHSDSTNHTAKCSRFWGPFSIWTCHIKGVRHIPQGSQPHRQSACFLSSMCSTVGIFAEYMHLSSFQGGER